MKITVFKCDNEEEFEKAIEIVRQKLDEEQSGELKPWPQIDDRYWIVDSEGDIHYQYWDNDDVDSARLSISNVFHTKAEAEKVIKHLKFRQWLIEQGGVVYTGGDGPVGWLVLECWPDGFAWRAVSKPVQGAVCFRASVKDAIDADELQEWHDRLYGKIEQRLSDED